MFIFLADSAGIAPTRHGLRGQKISVRHGRIFFWEILGAWTLSVGFQAVFSRCFGVLQVAEILKPSQVG